MSGNPDLNLAPFAVHELKLGPRRHAEPVDPLRSPFEVDRYRVLQSAAFRRLEYKTQVFVIHEHDHFRTRLTHTLEVAHIARQMAKLLRVNESLAEVIALAHDLGHPPFGHAGEATLNRLMADHGGFEHNLQSLRIVEYLEHPYPPFRGLNLTFEVREGLVKHRTVFDHPERLDVSQQDVEDIRRTGPMPSLEAQIASVADRLAYDCHDLEDGLGAGLVDAEQLETVELWSAALSPVRRDFPDLSLPAVRRPVLDLMLMALLDDVVSESRRRIGGAGVSSVDAVRQCSEELIGFSEPMRQRLEALEKFLLENLYHHHRLVRMDAKASRFIDELFSAYLETPRMLPPRYYRRTAEQGLHRVICDYLAGMTDRFCQDEYKRLFEPYEKV